MTSRDDERLFQRYRESGDPHDRTRLVRRDSRSPVSWRISDRVGMSQMSVSRLLRRCLPRLRELAESRGAFAA